MIIAALILFLVAAAFVAAELFLPSHGILGLCAILSAMASIYFAYLASPLLGFLFGLAVVIMAPFVFYWAIRIYPHTPLGKRVMLNTPTPTTSDGFASETQRLAQLVGQRGTAMTMLRPAGTIELDGHRIDAVSESEIIYPNTPVEIIRVAGLKVIVKACGIQALVCKWSRFSGFI